MRALLAAAVGLGLAASIGTASAQYYGGSEYGYRERGYGDRGYRERDYEDRDYRDRGYGRGYGGGRASYGFDEGEYLRCNPDVRRALRQGRITSAADHWRVFGQRERRQLTC